MLKGRDAPPAPVLASPSYEDDPRYLPRAADALGGDRLEGVRAERRQAASQIQRSLKAWRSSSGGASKGAKVPATTGSALAAPVRAGMERQLGADLSQVKVHTGAESSEAATNLGARAFTVGNDVHFNHGQFAPGTKEGDRLLAHELTHVVQGAQNKLSPSRVHRALDPDGLAALKAKVAPLMQGVTDAGQDGAISQARALGPMLKALAAPVPSQEKPAEDGKPPPLAEVRSVMKLNSSAITSSCFGLKSAWDKADGSTESLRVWSRLGMINAPVNQALAEATGIPLKPMGFSRDCPGKGRFQPKDWQMTINGGLLMDDTTDLDARIADLSEVLCHETLHAEQYFRVAQMHAQKQAASPKPDGKEWTADELATKIAGLQDIKDPEVLLQAATLGMQEKNKMGPDQLAVTQSLEAGMKLKKEYKIVHDAYGVAREARVALETTVKAELIPLSADLAAMDPAWKQQVIDSRKAATALTDEMMELIRSFPHENFAYELGQKVREAVAAYQAKPATDKPLDQPDEPPPPEAPPAE